MLFLGTRYILKRSTRNCQVVKSLCFLFFYSWQCLVYLHVTVNKDKETAPNMWFSEFVPQSPHVLLLKNQILFIELSWFLMFLDEIPMFCSNPVKLPFCQSCVAKKRWLDHISNPTIGQTNNYTHVYIYIYDS